VLVDTSPEHRVINPVAVDPAEMVQLPDVALTPIDIAKLDSWPQTTRLDASVSVVLVGTVSALAGPAVITAAVSAVHAAAASIVKIFCRLTAFLPRRVRSGAVVAGSAVTATALFDDLAETH